MKIERINENQIRCTLSHADLNDRQIELSELAYGSEKARRLFHELIQAAAAEVDFDVENMPLMVEAIPMSMDSIVLIVTRVEDPDELDTRFSRFSPAAEDDWDESDVLSELASGLLEGAAFLKEALHSEANPSASAKEESSNSSVASAIVPSSRLFVFHTLDQTAAAAAAINGNILVDSALYKDPANGQYYLCIHCGENEDAFRRTCNTLSEYGALRNSPAGVLAYCEEHCEIIIARRALDKLTRLL